MINGEGSSSLLTRLKIQEDIEERERRRIREKEKKEANLVLLQDLAEWEEKELGPDLVKQLHSMWEVSFRRIYWEIIILIDMLNIFLVYYYIVSETFFETAISSVHHKVPVDIIIFLLNRFLHWLAYYSYWKTFSTFKISISLNWSWVLFMLISLHY